MGSRPTAARRQWRRLLEITFVVVAVFAAGLATAGVVSGAGPLAVLSISDSTSTESTAPDTTTTGDSTTTISDPAPPETSSTESTEATTTASTPTPSGPPTIESDKDDYAPGELVTLTGSNWHAAEFVRIIVNDDIGQTWKRVVDATADAQGRLTDQFSLPDYFIASYTVTATGLLSGQATTAFTDAVNLTIQGSDDNQHETLNKEENLGSVQNGNAISLTCPRGTGLTVKVTGNPASVTWSVGYVLSGPDIGDGAALSPLTTFTPSSGTFAGNDDRCVAVSIATSTLTAGTTYHGKLAVNRTAGDPANPAFYFFRFAVTTAANTAPTASNISDSTNEDTAKSIGLSAADAQQCELMFSIVTAPTHGGLGSIGNNSCVSGSPNHDSASVTYTPAPNYNGPDSFTYKVNDGSLDSNIATVSITVNAVDDPPVAVNDTKTVVEDAAATTIDVLANDTDVDAGPRTIASVTQPAHGTVVNNNSNVTYAPNANYCNDGSPTDNFTYTLNGGSTATVAVTVTCVDDPPVAVNDAATVTEDSGANAINVLANDTDPDGGPKTVQSVTQPAHGSVSITGGGTGVSYTPAADYCNGGSPADTFTYTLNGGSSATVAVTVTCVNDPPVIAFTSGATSLGEGTTETYVFSITDPDSSSFTFEAGYPKCGAGGALVGTPTLGTSSGSFQCQFADGPASPIVAAKIRDASDPSSEITKSVDVANVAPKVTLNGPATADEGDTVSYSYSFTDPGADTWTHTTSCGAEGVRSDDVFTPATKSGSFKCTWADNHLNELVSAKVDDDDGGSDSATKSVDVANVAPKVTLNGPATADEGQTKSYGFTFTDPGADMWTRSVDCGSKGIASNSTFTPATKSGTFDCTFADGPISTVSATVSDDDGGAGTASRVVTVNNLPPVLTITAPPYGQVYAVGSATVTFKGSFTDPGSGDTHTCSAAWDDGTGSSSGLLVEPSGSTAGTCTAAHTYTAAGVYTISMTVTDDEGATDTEAWLVVVYDPNGGFVTGGGWIDSPAGAYAANPSLSGRANFGFVSKYQKGASVPSGETEFQFQVGNLNFHSSSYDWLVVAGSKAQYKGTGTINGSGTYTFLLTAWDGSPDKFRMKITSGGGLVYDNKVNVPCNDIDCSDPQAISGGSIAVHK